MGVLANDYQIMEWKNNNNIITEQFMFLWVQCMELVYRKIC